MWTVMGSLVSLDTAQPPVEQLRDMIIIERVYYCQEDSVEGKHYKIVDCYLTAVCCRGSSVAGHVSLLCLEIVRK